MPYEGEYAGYRPLQRIVESERVKELLTRSKVLQNTDDISHPEPVSSPMLEGMPGLPRFILGIDGSNAEVNVKNGYPGAKVGYCTVASVLIDLDMISRLDSQRPVDPKLFRNTEKASAIDAAMPGNNVITRRQSSARSSFRDELYDHFNGIIIDEDDRTRLIETYEELLDLKPKLHPQKCPYFFDDEECDHEFESIPKGHGNCPKCGRPIFSTDALRIHERFRDYGSNLEAFGLVMQIWERILLIYLLRSFEKRGLLDKLDKLAFFIDGPLAVFGPPAWLSAAISKELKRINSLVRAKTGNDMIIVGIEKSGEFVTHFEEIDQTEIPGKLLFSPRTHMLLTDKYIKDRIKQSTSAKRYGMDTYFGRKLFYKTFNGARIVASIPFLTDEQDTLDTDDISFYPRFGMVCALIDRLVSSRFPNALTPLISAHAEASIPLNLGTKVLTQLAKVLMGEA